MPRKGGVIRRETPPDPVYGNPMVTRIISNLMVRGKRSLAERELATMAVGETQLELTLTDEDPTAPDLLDTVALAMVKNLS